MNVQVLINKKIRPSNNDKGINFNRGRLILISILAVVIAICASLIAKFLVYLINLITNLTFYGTLSITHSNPASNHLGLWVVFVPAIGGVVVGLMAKYGSAAIRGHGIPEAMEQILTNQSRIKPTITYLKPISSAIAIGTGGPFGAEGPIIATGGALGSTIGQFIRITHNERKVLLAAGATAGMAAIFGSPIAGIFLAIELLLFEFSARSIVPVALACITGAAGHILLFEQGPVFATGAIINYPSNTALALYSLLGILIGFLSVVTTKIVYWVEDLFEKIPIHWMWWPAIGGLVVGIIGYFAPRTLGVGYNNITDILSGSLGLHLLFSLCIMKFISWAIALGSGTSGGTLAPLLTIGGAAGALLGSLAIQIFPSSGITVELSALVGMSALFAGASRAFLTSIIFALETTNQSNALLPLLATCGAAYVISLFFLRNTILTEKIARRGIKTPESYEPDMLEHTRVSEVMTADFIVVSASSGLKGLQEIVKYNPENQYIVVADHENQFLGVVNSRDLPRQDSNILPDENEVQMVRTGSITDNSSLREAVQTMANEKVEVLTVSSTKVNHLLGLITMSSIMTVYKREMDQHNTGHPNLSVQGTIDAMLKRTARTK